MVDISRGKASLVVFSDDWGRHPSSCQYLVRHLLVDREVLWVNTIGTRTPKFDLETFRRGTQKLKEWSGRAKRIADIGSLAMEMDGNESRRPKVLSPRMWPWFTGPLDRRLNRYLLESQLKSEIASLPRPVVAVTTLPLTADLVGRLPVDGWLYYCVDDFREWPGLDGRTLGQMEEELVRKVDSVVAVSGTLQDRMRDLGKSSQLLTHGVDLEFWRTDDSPSDGSTETPAADRDSQRPLLFWGVIDRRMDAAILQRLSQEFPERPIRLVGPQQNPDPAIGRLPNIELRPAVALSQLPILARDAAALVMPYADLPVTRAMQPLKLKEYLATGKPVVVRRLPATDEWNDAMDVAETPEAFADAVRQRLNAGVPDSQRVARERLRDESWQAKAELLSDGIERTTNRSAAEMI